MKFHNIVPHNDHTGQYNSGGLGICLSDQCAIETKRSGMDGSIKIVVVYCA